MKLYEVLATADFTCVTLRNYDSRKTLLDRYSLDSIAKPITVPDELQNTNVRMVTIMDIEGRMHLDAWLNIQDTTEA